MGSNAQEAPSKPLSNDVSLDMSGFCSGCPIGSSASGFLFTTFLGPNAEGALGSFGAQTSPPNMDAPEAIAGVFVAERVENSFGR
jgi:hypothetical protein